MKQPTLKPLCYGFVACLGLAAPSALAVPAAAPVAPFDINAGHIYGPAPVPFTTIMFHVETFTSPSALSPNGSFVFAPRVNGVGGKIEIDFPALSQPLQFDCEAGNRILELSYTFSLPTGKEVTTIATKEQNHFKAAMKDFVGPKDVTVIFEDLDQGGLAWSLINCHVTAKP